MGWLGTIDSTTVKGQKRVLIIGRGSSFTLILLHMKAVAVARNPGACCLQSPSGVVAEGTGISSAYASLVISYSSI